MKSIFWIFSIFSELLTGLTINFNFNIYAQKSSFNKENTNFNIAVAADWGCE